MDSSSTVSESSFPDLLMQISTYIDASTLKLLIFSFQNLIEELELSNKQKTNSLEFLTFLKSKLIIHRDDLSELKSRLELIDYNKTAQLIDDYNKNKNIVNSQDEDKQTREDHSSILLDFIKMLLIIAKKLTKEEAAVLNQWFPEIMVTDAKAARDPYTVLKTLYRKNKIGPFQLDILETFFIENSRLDLVEILCAFKNNIQNKPDDIVIEFFAGQSKHIENIVKYLEGGTKVVFVHGFPGLGKTSLAKQAMCHFVVERPNCVQRILDMRLHHFTLQSNSLDQFYRLLLEQLGLETPLQNHTLTTEETVNLISSSMKRKFEEEKIILIDNADKVSQLEEFANFVRLFCTRNPRRIFLIITSRFNLVSEEKMERLYRLELSSLGKEDSRQLIEVYSQGAVSDPEVVDKLAQVCGYHPLTMKLKAAWELKKKLNRVPISKSEMNLAAWEMYLSNELKGAENHKAIVDNLMWVFSVLKKEDIVNMFKLVVFPDFFDSKSTCLVLGVKTSNEAIKTLCSSNLVERFSKKYRLHLLLKSFLENLLDNHPKYESYKTDFASAQANFISMCMTKISSYFNSLTNNNKIMKDLRVNQSTYLEGVKIMLQQPNVTLTHMLDAQEYIKLVLPSSTSITAFYNSRLEKIAELRVKEPDLFSYRYMFVLYNLAAIALFNGDIKEAKSLLNKMENTIGESLVPGFNSENVTDLKISVQDEGTDSILATVFTLVIKAEVKLRVRDKTFISYAELAVKLLRSLTTKTIEYRKWLLPPFYIRCATLYLEYARCNHTYRNHYQQADEIVEDAIRILSDEDGNIFPCKTAIDACSLQGSINFENLASDKGVIAYEKAQELCGKVGFSNTETEAEILYQFGFYLAEQESSDLALEAFNKLDKSYSLFKKLLGIHHRNTAKAAGMKVVARGDEELIEMKVIRNHDTEMRDLLNKYIASAQFGDVNVHKSVIKTVERCIRNHDWNDLHSVLSKLKDICTDYFPELSSDEDSS